MNDITIDAEILRIHDIQDDKELFDAQMISNLKKAIADLEDDITAAIDEVKDKDKRIAELEAGIQNARDIWHDGEEYPDAETAGNAVDSILSRLLSEGGADIAESGEIDWSTMGNAAGTVKEGGADAV